MSDITVYSVSAINTLSARYYDPFYQYKQYRTAYEQGFSLNRIQALSSTVDTTINNYTSQYLTSKKRLDEVFTINEKPIALQTITTPLIFNTFFNTDEPRYLYIYKNTLSGADSPEATCRALLSSEATFTNNRYFELEILNSEFLRIKHNNGRKDYFLNFIATGSQRGQNAFYSYSSDTPVLTSERNDMFRYLLDSDGYLQIFKLVTVGNGIENRVLTLSGDRITFVTITSGGMTRANNNVIKINYNFNKLSPKSASSWISYDSKRQNDLIIDESKSSFNRRDQYLLHTNYNTSNSDLLLNYITLNNARSEKNYIKRGASLIDSNSKYYPDVEFRDYMSLQTGLDQEKGNDNIALTYVWYDKDIKVVNGTDTVFVAPSSIYPYNRLNINDTKFIVNGALGGKSPVLSDNIYCLRRDTSGFNNGRYLCTWLSGGNNKLGLWVDRYYYPDLITKENAMLEFPVYEPSFIDPIDNLGVADKERFVANAFFDKKSDLCIEPNITYKYSRVGADDINSYIYNSSPIVSSFTNYYTDLNKPQPYFSNSIIYDGTRYNKFILSDKINESSAFTISFDIYVDPEANYGYQLLGNLTNRGFGVVNDEQVTPFLFVFDGNKIKSYNSTFGTLYTTTFDTDVLDIVKGKGLNDFHVICNSGYVYKVNALGTKTKLEIVPEIVSYRNYCQDENFIYFLKNNTTGECVRVDKNSLEASSIIAQKFGSYSTYSTSGIKGLLIYNNTLYGVPGENVKYANPNLVYYTLQDKKLLKHDLLTDTVVEFIDTTSKIVDFIIDPNENIIILHNVSKVSVYDKTRGLLFTQNYAAITPGLQLVGADIVRQYASNSVSSSIDVVLAFIDPTKKLYIYSLNNNNAVFTGLSGVYTDYNSLRPRRYKITDYNFYRQLPIENKLNFNLTLTNYLSTENIVNKNISFDYTTIDRGYHTFTYRFDPIQGNITLFVDGDRYENLTVPPGKYAIQDIFSDDLYIGSTGFYNGIDLATYLNQPGYYFINNLRLKNLFIYDKAIKDSEIIALNIFGESINDIILSIPAGQRNNMEEIERYFRFSPNASSSNKINIYLKNLGINNQDIKNNIKNLIMQEASTLLPAGVGINDIQFIDFK